MKIGLFSDSHYSSAPLTCQRRYNNQSLRKIEEALSAFRECDLVITLGDLTDVEHNQEKEENNLRQIAGLLDQSGLECICLMGNHDAYAFAEDAFYALLGEKRRPCLISREGIHLLFLDACYFSSGEHYSPGHVIWTDTFYPHVQQLKELLADLQGNVYVFMHQNIDPEVREDHLLSNAAEIRSILEESGKVKAVYQGHYHWGNRNAVNGIDYITLPAMCENEQAYWVEELE